MVVEESQLHLYFSSGKYFTAEIPTSKYAKAGGEVEAGGMISPMPGKITMIMVEPGTPTPIRVRVPPRHS